MAVYLKKWRWWLLLALMAPAFAGPGVYLVQGANEPTVAGTAEVHASSATQLTVLSPFTGDENRDGYTKVEYGTDATWGNGDDVTACASSTGGSPRVCWVPKLTASTTYYIRVTYTDPDGVSGTAVQTLSTTTGAGGVDTWPPTLSIIKPMDGGTVAGNADYPITIDFTVFDKTGISAVHGDVQVIIDGTAYNATTHPKKSGYYTYDWTTPTVGWHSVTAKAKDTAGNIGYAPTAQFYVNSVAINSAGVFTGDGTLLVRDNDNQICQDCHKGIKPHSSASTGAKYGNWSLTCRQCHTPHNTKNIFLIKEQIRTPNSGTRNVDFRAAVSRTDTTTNGSNTDYSFTSKTNPGTGPCEVCHTRTGNRNDGTPRYRNTGSGPDNTSAGGAHANPPFTEYPCIKCHNHKNGFAHGAGTGGGKVQDCLPCHGHDAGYSFSYGGTNYVSEGRGNYRTHSTHTENDADDLRGPNVFCDTCHDINNMPFFKSGTDSNGDGQFSLDETDVCAACHSSGGAFNGVNTVGSSVGAKDNFKAVNGDYANGGVYNADGTLKAGKEKWCAGCHDEAPSTINGKTAPIITGDNSTYGFFANGHGKPSGNYAKLSWQDTTATGNPAANRICHECHNTAYAHIGNSDAGTPRNKRLQWWDATEQSNKTCKQCHDNANPDAVAKADPQWYTTYADWQNSAHGSTSKGNLQCARCHEPHGMGGANKPAMTRDLTETLCFNCHTGDAGAWMNVQNDAVSGSSLATSIEQAFGFGVKHPLGQSFTLTDYGNKTFTLNCISCHNVHLVTGKYWEADQNKSPITKLTDNLNVWGDTASEKMTAYVGSGTYRTPNEPAGAQFTGDQLPDYPSFCLSCHGDSPTDVRTGASTTYSGNTHFGISWTQDPHGKESANMGNNTGTCPDWYGCGKAQGWSDDVCTGTQSDCWPALPRGRGEQTWTRDPYKQEERIAGANFTLACINCHEAHGSNNGSMLRTNPNGGTGSTTWNTMCNNCHWYYSDWHSGMSCGSASCHEVNSIHRMKKNNINGATRTWEPSQVVWYAFENNMNDSGTWRMHGEWKPDNPAGTYTTGKSGQAAVFDGTNTVQVGTRNSYWSTDAGNHGTWVYTEMKYNTTQEAWVYLTDSSKSEYSIFTKHTGYSNGGYAFVLRNINGVFRPVFLMQADNNSFSLGGNAGVRGAYGATGVPLNTWTHVAVTFDTAGPDRDPGDPTVGRIRIYINGVDVTASNSSGDLMQPGANETSIFAYSENSNYNESVCYNGNWCASEFSIGGFYGWQSTFVGRIDEAKVWNITKAASYFTPIDQSTAPTLLAASWDSTLQQVLVTFTEGVYTTTGASGALTAADFTLASAGGRTITSVTHTAGSYSALLTLSSPLDSSTINVATVAAASTTAIYDKYNNAAGTTARTITGEICPSYPVTFSLNEAGTSTIKETQNIISGTAYYDNDNNDTTALVASTTAVAGGVYTGNGPTVSAGSGSNYAILFNNNLTCLGATTGVALEARIKPTGIPANTTTNYVGRIFGKWNDTDNTISHQLSVWRQPAGAGFANYSPAANTASIALWIKVSDMHATTNYRYKPILTEATNTGSAEYCRIENDHWYYVKATFNTNKPGGTPGQPFVPGDIYVEDQGTDGAGAGRNWVGLKNCTDADQSQFSTPTASDNRKLYTADVNVAGTGGRFTIGADPACKTGASGCTQVTHFNGSIDYVIINEMPPSAPTIGTATSLSPYSIRWNFTDIADTEDGFSVHDSSEVVKATSATQNLTYLDEGSLTPNTQYTRHVHAYNTGGDSIASANASRYTLSVTPGVTSDKATSTWYGTPDVVFTNAAGFGAGGVQYYRYAWNQSASYTFNDTETQWSTGTLTRTATVAGMWYLHVKAYNGDNVANGTQTYGPYYYNTPPTVTATLPDNGATGVALNGSINIAWSQNMNCATINTTNITISGGGWALSSCSGNEAVFTTSGQSNATTYTVTVTTAVTDATGNPMAANYPFSYTTAP